MPIILQSKEKAVTLHTERATEALALQGVARPAESGLGRSAQGAGRDAAPWHMTCCRSVPRSAPYGRLLYPEETGPWTLGSGPRGRVGRGRGPRHVASSWLRHTPPGSGEAGSTQGIKKQRQRPLLSAGKPASPKPRVLLGARDAVPPLGHLAVQFLCALR